MGTSWERPRTGYPPRGRSAQIADQQSREAGQAVKLDTSLGPWARRVIGQRADYSQAGPLESRVTTTRDGVCESLGVDEVSRSLEQWYNKEPKVTKFGYR